jgi:serine/threonine-protein kinase
MGTPFYIPKEQIESAKEADHRSDIYSLGATFYHMLTGKPPFEESASSGQMAVLEAIVNHNLVPLKERCPYLPSSICNIVEKAMAPSPEKRYTVATDLKKDLEAFIKSVEKK